MGFFSSIAKAVSSVAKVALPAIASYYAPGVAGALGITSALGTAAVGAGMGALTSAATGGNPITGAITGGIGGYIAAPTAPAAGVGSSAVGDIAASIMQANPQLTAEEAAAAAQVYAGSGYTSTTWGSSIGSGGTIPLANLIQPIGQNALASLASGAASLYGANLASDAARNATQETTRQFDIAQANQAPWLQAGQRALIEQQKLMYGTPQAVQASLETSPGYLWRRSQGQRMFDASVAPRGGFGSGKTGVGALEYGQNYASGEYGNRLNQLAAMSGTGQTTASNLAGQGAQYAGEIGTGILAGGAARQSGITGAANALTGWLNPVKQPTGIDPSTGRYIYA